MIYANSCEKCKIMKQTINSFLSVNKLNGKYKLYSYECSGDESIDIALEYDLSDVPSCNILGEVVEGEDYDKEDLMSALEKLLR